MTVKRRLVVTFDAFGTLFYPKGPIGKQYADIARSHQLSGFTNEQIGASFKDAFRAAQSKYPNYGKATGMGATVWWSNVIRSTFESSLQDHFLPPKLIPDLLHRFSSSEGYMLFPGVSSFFSRLAKLKAIIPREDLHVGVISNSDDRIPSILESLGFQVGPVRYSDESKDSKHTTAAPISASRYDFDFVILSYDVGSEKPDRNIFDAARCCAALASSNAEHGCRYLHIGDDWENDVLGAREAGWEAARLGGEGRSVSADPEEGLFFQDVDALYDYIERIFKACAVEPR